MKDKRVNFICRTDQFSNWQEKAKSEHRSLSNWITSVCDAACADHLKEWEKDDGVRGKYYEQAVKADDIAAKLGVTKGGEILEKPTAKIVAPKPAPKKKNQVCEVLGHVPMITDDPAILKCSRCDVRWNV